MGGGDFPGEHEFSELSGLDNSDGGLDGAFAAGNDLLNNWRGNRFVGLNLFGKPGTGKTHFAIGLGRALHDIGADVAYQYVPAIPKDSEKDSVAGWMVSNHCPSNQTPYNVFGASNEIGNKRRNRMAALILDDYNPAKQREVMAAVEAAAQFGGLIILTSNHNDPYKILDSASRVADSPVQLAISELAKQLNPNGFESMQKKLTAEREGLRESLRSRLLAGVRDIWFTGEDRREKNSFWDGS